ncbi:TonB-dependent receptor [Coprobacter fastidiosus]|jgi:outer membrane receptor for ferrienterochelin and colicins|uniref:TonB-dependent receptor n=1 Tax=Coprobacter fastidiosus TaxID=1099853 RepID=UPI00241DC1FB|nr:TonB-dependent receptor [Coprobacter fastidiosus]
MKTVYIFLLGAILALFPGYSFAFELKDTDANVIGHVTDKDTKEHLSYVTILVKGTTIGTTTDDTGHYFLKNLPEGTFTLEVRSVGYRTETRTVNLVKGKTLELNFEIEEDRVALDDVVVSANRNETTRRMAPTLVNVLPMKTFENTNSTCLAQGLNFQPGVRVENNCQNCGYQQVRINGLDGPYTQILIDSRPIFSALAGVYGLEQIPANMIDRVEVMRGGGSALFGSSAIAGTINIITKEPSRNSAQFSHTLTGIGDASVFENNTTLNASLVSDNQKLGLAVFGQNRERAGYDHDGDGFTELPELKNQTVGLRSYIKTGDYSKITVEYHHMQEFRRGGDRLDRPAHESLIAEQLQHSINTGGVKFDMFSPDERHRLGIYTSAQHIDRDSYYGGGEDLEEKLKSYGNTTDMTWVAGAQYSYNFDRCLFMPATLTLGSEYNQDNLKDNMWGRERYIDQKVRTISAFLQNEWKNEKWSLLVGGRLDKHSMLDKPVFSPRANLRFNPTEDISLRASYSFGFRAPQAFDEDLHIDNVGGTVSMIQLAEDLKEEKSQSISLSADMYHNWGDWQGNLLLEGFYTNISDVFALTEIGKDQNGVIINERGNEKGAYVYGCTLEGKLAWRNVWQFQAGFTLQKAEYKEARSWSDDDPNIPLEKRMFRTPDGYGYFTMTYNPLQSLTLALSGTYTGNMLVEHHKRYIKENRTEKTPDFFDMGFKAAYDFKLYKSITLQVNAGVQNIFNAYQSDFDKGAERDSGYIYGPGMPRSVYAGLKLSY